MKISADYLRNLKARPIPDLAEARKKRVGYRSHAIDTGHALYPEKLVNIADYGIRGVNYYYRTDNPPYHQRFPGAIPELYLRESVARKLQAIDKSLHDHGLRLHVHEAWRPYEVQDYAYNVWMPAELKRKYPDLEGEALTNAVKEYWAEPTRSETSPAPHSTGGAVDLSLYGLEHGEPLFMGTIFDDVSALAATDSFEARVGSESYSDQEAIANRRLLYWLMIEAGFANQLGEWWHYGWGDQMWARLTGQASAFYGPSGPETILGNPT